MMPLSQSPMFAGVRKFTPDFFSDSLYGDTRPIFHPLHDPSFIAGEESYLIDPDSIAAVPKTLTDYLETQQKVRRAEVRGDLYIVSGNQAPDSDRQDYETKKYIASVKPEKFQDFLTLCRELIGKAAK